MTKSTTYSEMESVDSTVRVLVRLMQDVADELPATFESRGSNTIRNLGLTSVRILEFMVEVEDQFGVEWGEDLDPAVVSSFDAMAEYVLEKKE